MKFFLIAGIMCLAYYIVTLIAGGFSKFPLIWLGLGCACIGGYFGRGYLCNFGLHVPVPLRIVFWCIVTFLVLGVLIVEIMIIRTGRKPPMAYADYIIILGAQVKGVRPSKALLRRIMTACDYMKTNPETKAILSGGKGPDEEISEAECMRRVLVQSGIDQQRLILEDKSVNTLENLKYSLADVGYGHRIVIATCNFHQLRAQAVARKLGMREVSGIGSGSGHMLKVNDYFREFFALLKYYISGLI